MDTDMQIKAITFEISDIQALRAIAVNPLAFGIPLYVHNRLLRWGAVRYEDMLDERGRPTFYAEYLTDLGVRVLDIADRTGHTFVSIPASAHGVI